MISYQRYKIDSLTLATILAYVALFGAAAIPQAVSLIFRTMCVTYDFFIFSAFEKEYI